MEERTLHGGEARKRLVAWRHGRTRCAFGGCVRACAFCGKCQRCPWHSMIDDDGKLRAGRRVCVRACVSVAETELPDVLVPCPWNNALCILIVGGHTDASLCVPLGCVCGYARERGDDFGKHGSPRRPMAARRPPAGQPAIRDDEIGWTETTRARE